MHNLFICALSHTFGSCIHNRWRWSFDYLLNSAHGEQFAPNRLSLPRSDDQESPCGWHHCHDYRMFQFGRPEISSATSATCLHNGARPRHNNKNSVSRLMVLFVVARGVEYLHQRDHYLYDAMHRTNIAGQCQSGTVRRVLLSQCRTLRKWFPKFMDLSTSVTPSRCLRCCARPAQSLFSRLRLAIILLFAVAFVLLEGAVQASESVLVTLSLTRWCAVSMPEGPCPTDVISSLCPSCTSKC